MSAFEEDDVELSKRDILVREHLHKHNISNILDASDDLIAEAEKEADKVLGKGNDN